MCVLREDDDDHMRLQMVCMHGQIKKIGYTGSTDMPAVGQACSIHGQFLTHIFLHLSMHLQDRSIRLWSLPNLVSKGMLKGHKRGVWSVSFAPLERALLSASGEDWEHDHACA